MARDIRGKIISKLSEQKQKLVGGSSYWEIELLRANNSKCMKEIQGKSTLVRVSASFKFVRIQVIESQLYSWENVTINI